MSKQTYKLVPLSGDTGSQLVEGAREAREIAQEIADREHATVNIYRGRHVNGEPVWTVKFDRLTIARALADQHSPHWCEADPQEIAQHRYAVVIERYSDSWLSGADDAQELAETALGLNSGDGDEFEWIAEVWDLDAGEQIRVDFRETWTATIVDTGETAAATYSPVAAA